MNKIDKEWYKHLNALSKIPVDKPYGKYRVEVTKKFGKYMEGETWNELHKLGYINNIFMMNRSCFFFWRVDKIYSIARLSFFCQTLCIRMLKTFPVLI